MARNLVVSAGGRTVRFPLSRVVAAEIVAHVAILAVCTGVGAIFGHPFIGAAAGVALCVTGEVVEYKVAKKAIANGSLRAEVR